MDEELVIMEIKCTWVASCKVVPLFFSAPLLIALFFRPQVPLSYPRISPSLASSGQPGSVSCGWLEKSKGGIHVSWIFPTFFEIRSVADLADLNISYGLIDYFL